MAVIHTYAQSADQTGYYLKGWTPKSGHTTIQTRQVCNDLFEWLDFPVGDQIPRDLLNGLLEVDLLYTGDPATADENIPDDFQIKQDIKNVLTEEQYDRLIGFVKSYGDQAPSQVVDLISQLDAETAVVDSSCIPDTPGGGDRQPGEIGCNVDHGQFKGIIDEIYDDEKNKEAVDPLTDLKSRLQSARSAISYHHNQQEVIEAKHDDDDDWLEYATRALLSTDDGIVSGPICGFRVSTDETDIVVIEIIPSPEDSMRRLTYGEEGICHRVVLGDETIDWETTLSEQSEYRLAHDRSELLKHQIKCLQTLETTLGAHPGISKQGMIEQVVAGGYLEHGVRMTQDIWEDSSLLGELLSPISVDGKSMGTVVFFNDTGGYGFIETDAREQDVFYHMEDIGGADIKEGEKINFNIIEAEKGPRATDVERF